MNRLIIISLFLSCSLSAKSQAKHAPRARFFEDSAWKVYQKHYFRKSIALLDSALFYDPTNGFSYSLKAEAQWFLGNYADAAETYKKKISLGDENLLKVGANVLLGMLYGKAGMPEQAKAQYAFAVKLWESGYEPLKQFEMVEVLDYFLALAFLEEKAKAVKIISECNLDDLTYPRRRELENQHKRCLLLFEKNPEELLEEHFKIYMLPDDIKPLEE